MQPEDQGYVSPELRISPEGLTPTPLMEFTSATLRQGKSVSDGEFCILRDGDTPRLEWEFRSESASGNRWLAVWFSTNKSTFGSVESSKV